MKTYLAVLLLLASAAAMVVASPLVEVEDDDDGVDRELEAIVQKLTGQEEDDDGDRMLQAIVEMLKDQEDDDGNKLAKVQLGNTDCARRSHKVYFDIGRKTHIFRYRACFNHATNTLCYDSKQRLPKYCPWFFRGEDCVGVEWKIHGFTNYFEICDNFGRPCQKRIRGISRTTSSGQCIGRPPPPYLDAKEMTSNDDCMCVIKKGKKSCEGTCP